MINGHAFAGGFFMAICADFRIMREERGYMCLNEAELGSPIPQALLNLGIYKSSIDTMHQASVFSWRFDS